jgi:hypothetical protein
MDFLKRQALLAAVVSVAIGLVGFAPGPAQAAPSGSDCPFVNTVCLFEGENFTGDRFTVSSLSSSGVCVSLVDHGWADRAHSAINTNTGSAALFMNDDCLGGPFQISGGSSRPSFGGFTPDSIWVP